MKENKKIYDHNIKKKEVLSSYKKGNNSQENIEITKDNALLIQQDNKQKNQKANSLKRLRLNPEQQKIHKLENKIKRSDLKFEIMKNAGEILYQETTLIFKFIADNEKKYPIRLMCEILNINRSTYHRWKRNFISETQKRKIVIQHEITSIFFSSKQRYGSLRITAVLHNSGYEISNSTVGKYMRELGHCSIIIK